MRSGGWAGYVMELLSNIRHSSTGGDRVDNLLAKAFFPAISSYSEHGISPFIVTRYDAQSPSGQSVAPYAPTSRFVPAPSGYEADLVFGSLTFPASVYFRLEERFPKRTSVLAYPLPLSLFRNDPQRFLLFSSSAAGSSMEANSPGTRRKEPLRSVRASSPSP
jgi:hypothetical protein